MSTIAAEIAGSKNRSRVYQGHSSTIVPINPDGSQLPLYLIHEIAGEIDCYVPLARALGSDQPVYGFQLTGHELEHPRGVDAIARAYLRELRDFHPAGPYILGGYSFGGIIAFEMAKRLTEEGERSPLVVMFDTGVPASTQRVGVGEKVRVFLQNTKIGGLDYLSSRIKIKRDYWRRNVENRLLSFAGSAFQTLGHRRTPLVRRAQAEIANRRAIARYRPSHYLGAVLLFACANKYETLSNREDPLLGWGALAESGFEMLTVSTDHTGLMKEPAIQIVIERLRDRLSSIC